MSLIPHCKYRGDIIYLQLLYLTVLLISQTKQVQNNPHGHPNCSVDGPQIWGGIRRQGENNCAINIFGLLCSQVYCSDILDAITKDFFARKGGAMDETTHVTDIQVIYSKKLLSTIDHCLEGGNVLGPARVRENKLLLVEAERGVLCRPHTESLEGPPGETLDSVQVSTNPFQVVRRKVQKSKSKQSVASKKANNGKQIKVKSA